MHTAMQGMRVCVHKRVADRTAPMASLGARSITAPSTRIRSRVLHTPSLRSRARGPLRVRAQDGTFTPPHPPDPRLYGWYLVK